MTNECSRPIELGRTRRARGRLAAVLVVGALAFTDLARAAETITYYYTSPQGTVLATADSVGNVLTTSDYRPYGSQALGTPENGPGYTGHVNDSDTGLVYMQARYYDSEIGRFLSVDPLGLEVGDVFSTNGYVYVENNPVGNWDPFGLCSADVDTPSCPQDQQPDPPAPQPTTKDDPPLPPSPENATPLPGMRVTATTTTGKVDMGGIPPPIFRPPGGRALFSRSFMRVLLEKADDAASNALVKKLSFKTLKITKTGFLKPTPLTFGVWALTHSEPLGGCDNNGNCRDEAPVSSLRNVPPGSQGSSRNSP